MGAALLSSKKLRISTLRLSDNEFGSEGCMHIVSVLPNNKTLTDLDLSLNGMDGNVALELAENTAIKMESGIVVRPARLKRLNISHNNIGTEAGVAIIEALSTEKTTFMDLSNCALGPECGEALARGLRAITCGWSELIGRQSSRQRWGEPNFLGIKAKYKYSIPGSERKWNRSSLRYRG